MRKTRSEFDPSRFTATKWATAEDKAQALEALARFVEGGFQRKAFTRRLYDALHLHMYGHIAEFNIDGFYGAWFSTLARQVGWVEYVIDGGAYGQRPASDPAHTWSDAERAFRRWLTASPIPRRLRDEMAAATERAERALLAELLAKYPDAAPAAA
jgi:hypothetical protein